MASVATHMLGSALATGATILTNLLGLRPSDKRRPEDLFKTKEDVTSALRDLCLARIPKQLILKLHKAFVERAVQDNDEMDGPYWSEETLVRLFKNAGYSSAFAAEAAPFSWRLVKAHAAFPFPADDQDDRLHWLQFLSAFALSTSGASVLSNPGYYHSSSSDVDRRGPARKRGVHQRMRLLFQNLASVPPDSDTSNPSGSKSHSNEDLIDVMAVCMNVDDDKYAFYTRDFISATNKLPSSMTNRMLDWKMAPHDWKLLLRLAVHYVAQCLGIQPGNGNEHLALAEVVAQRIQCHRQKRRQRQDMGWRDFHRTASSSLPHLSHYLDRYIARSLLGTFPGRQNPSITPEGSTFLGNGTKGEATREIQQPFRLCATEAQERSDRPLLDDAALVQIAFAFGDKILRRAQAARKTTNLKSSTDYRQKLRDFILNNVQPALLLVSAHSSTDIPSLLAIYTTEPGQSQFVDEKPTACCLMMAPQHELLTRLHESKARDQSEDHKGKKAHLWWETVTEETETPQLTFNFFLSFDQEFRFYSYEDAGGLTNRYDIDTIEVWPL